MLITICLSSLLLSISIALPLTITPLAPCSSGCSRSVTSSYPPDSTGYPSDACLCGDIDYMKAVARCIADECPTAELAQSASTAYYGCEASGNTLAIGMKGWMAQGPPSSISSTTMQSLPTSTTPQNLPTSASTETSAASSTTTGNPTSSTTSSAFPPGTTKSSGRYTEDQKIALGVGINFGLPCSLIGIIGLFIKYG